MEQRNKLPADKELILEKHCPSMSLLYLDDNGRAFRERILAAMEDYTEETRSSFRKQLNDRLKELYAKGDKLALALRRIVLSVIAHPSYTNAGEWGDFVNAANETMAEWKGEKEPEPGKLTPEQIEERKEAIEWYRNPAAYAEMTDGQIIADKDDVIADYKRLAAEMMSTIESLKRNKGAVWVKASERLPVHDNPIPVKYNAQYNFGNFYEHEEGGISFYFSWGGMNGQGVSGEAFDHLYWLDESAGEKEDNTLAFAEWAAVLYKFKDSKWEDDDGHYFTTAQLWDKYQKEVKP